MTANWRLQGACLGSPAELFIGPYGERPAAQEKREAQAKAVCAPCPSRLACLEFSLTVPVSGVFGGMDDGERAAEAARRGILPWCPAGLHRMQPGSPRCWLCKADSDRRRAGARRQRERTAA